MKSWRLRGDADEVKRGEALTTLIEQGWGQDNPALRQLFTTMFAPDGGAADVDGFNEQQRVSVSPRNAARPHELSGLVDVSEMLSQVRAPTLGAALPR